MKFLASASSWNCRCAYGHGKFACRVPPSPDVMAAMYMEYKRSAAYKKKSFKQYLADIGFTDPSVDTLGMDDAVQFEAAADGPRRLSIPSRPVTGEVRVKVLLVDFPDRPGTLDRSHYEDLLFSKGQYPTGSMRDFYREASHGKVDVTGTVDGWLRMPEQYSYYTNGESGTEWDSYPHNAPRLAEDAVKAALAQGVTFDPGLDKFGRGIVTALFIVHSGRGAEVMNTTELQRKHIWSHKWNFKNPVKVGPDLDATIYLTVPNDCKVGVCAHELGHLAFEWQDFYDPNYAEDGYWDGSGVWDLMAGGSYNGDGARPAHPAPLHKLQHGWISATTVSSSQKLTIKPYTATAGQIVKVTSPKFDQRQYLLLENRQKRGFDFDLPGEGLLVWKVDEPEEMNSSSKPGLSLVQADGRNDLDNPSDWNQGDASDPFPGADNHTELLDSGSASTSFAGTPSGISLKNIAVDANGVITLDLSIANVSAAGAPVRRTSGKTSRTVSKAKIGKKAGAKSLKSAKAARKRGKKKGTRSRSRPGPDRRARRKAA